MQEFENFEEECHDDIIWHKKFLNRCFSHGYDVNHVNKQRDSLLIWLLKNYDGTELFQLVEFLFDKGADLSYSIPKTGTNALLVLVQSCNNDYTTRTTGDAFRILHFFIEKGIDVNHRDVTGANALWEACKLTEMPAKDLFKLVSLLLENKVDVHASAKKDPAPNAFMLLLANRGRRARPLEEGRYLQLTVDLFIKHGIDLNAKMADGSSILMVLVRYFYRPPIIMKDMLEVFHAVVFSGVDLNAVDDSGKNVLNILCSRNLNYEASAHSEFHSTLRLLINKGIDVNNVDSQGNNALLNLVIHSRRILPKVTLPLMKLLLSSGIDYNQRNKNGKTVWDVVSSRGDVPSFTLIEIAELLVTAGAEAPQNVLGVKLTEDEIEGLVLRGLEMRIAGISASEYLFDYYGLDLSDETNEDDDDVIVMDDCDVALCVEV